MHLLGIPQCELNERKSGEEFVHFKRIHRLCGVYLQMVDYQKITAVILKNERVLELLNVRIRK